MAKSKIETVLSTEEKIKEAARKVFTQKGYAATRTRDIADEAGINLALLNYYFRSKEKLFELVMTEKMSQFFGFIGPAINDEDTTLQNKLESIAEHYVDLLQENPDLPIFVLGAIRSNPGHFIKIIKDTNVLTQSAFLKQIQKKKPGLNPFHFLMNLLGMCVFPFIAKPIFETMKLVDEKSFNKMMQERKALIPLWVKAMLEV